MSTLYIDRKNTELRLESNALVAYVNNTRQRPVPLALIERIVLVSNVQCSSLILGRLAEQGIAVSFINLRKNHHQATLIGRNSKNPAVRLAQYQAHQDSAIKAEIAKQLIMAKIRNHQRLLKDIALERLEHRYALGKADKQFTKILQSLQHKETAIETLRGIEGQAAKLFFQNYSPLFSASLDFNGRKRRPPPDPVNATLSLSYTLLHNRAIQISHASGLDPMIGFLHEIKYSRDSLAADLIEPWRAHIDRWVWHWFAQRYLRAEHFSTEKGACMLGKRGRAKFYAAYETRMRPLHRAMRWQVNGLKKELLKRYG